LLQALLRYGVLFIRHDKLYKKGEKDLLSLYTNLKTIHGKQISKQQIPCNIKFTFFILLFLFLFIVVLPVFSHAGTDDSVKQLFSDKNSNESWHITADEFNYDNNLEHYIATGDVVLVKGKRRISADYAKFDNKNMTVLAKGSVVLTTNGDIITGTSMHLDLVNETGVIDNGSIFIKEKHFYIQGDKLIKEGENEYSIDNAQLTSCNGKVPDWKITGRKLNITIEGYGTIKHATLWAKKLPVVYTPYFIFPVKRKRQTGFLLPKVGSSTRKGFEYQQPFFWAINDNTDATFYEYYMSKRGFMNGVEYRYVLDENSKGTMMFNYLRDNETDTGGDSSEKWGYEGDNYLRPNSDRYWFRMKNNQKLPAGFTAKLDVDVVSDQDYLTEFKEGFTGYEKTSAYFTDVFGRSIDDYDNNERLNRLNISKSWTNYIFNGDLRWYDNIVKENPGEKNTTLQQLPKLEFDGVKQQLFNSPFYFTLDSEYSYFYRLDEETFVSEGEKDLVRGQRVDIYPRFYLPYRFDNFFTFEPSVGLRETAWYVDDYEHTLSKDDGAIHRELYDIKLDLSTLMDKVFDVNLSGIDKVKHSIKPQVVYEYMPDGNKDNFPYFDSIDDMEKKNIITYSLTNTFTFRKKLKLTKKPELPAFKKTDAYIPVEYLYQQMLWMKLEQSYDIDKERSDLPEPFSSIKCELTITPFNYLAFRGDTTWSPYDNEFRTGNAGIMVSDYRGDSITTEYRYTGDNVFDEDDELLTPTKSIYTNAQVRLNKLMLIYGVYEHSLLESKTLKSGIGFLYEAQCWSIDILYTKEENDKKIAFMINLYGLGKTGNK